jgi:hypothetical protein
MLDGEELVPCAATAPNPSCAAGGTHATRVESFQRVRYNPVATATAAGNTWTVTARDGTTYTYAATTAFTADKTYAAAGMADELRYVLRRAQDTHGNTVLYDYACDSVAICAPEAITYNGTRSASRSRPNPTRVATGATLETVGRGSPRSASGRAGRWSGPTRSATGRAPAPARRGSSRCSSRPGRDGRRRGQVTGTALPETRSGTQDSPLGWSAPTGT